eukprot:TRINITY_DN14076_c0_g1_i3.p1 TRINITY_DN14076_c0_g1~~TRINITY_DN14076_c0_g1_i3.p1  ORF type:complete len:241 (-),score=55.31 TRINITY_DN14076_c0_g1_i3:30-752(-)
MQQGSKGRSGRSRSLRSQGSAPKLQELQTLRLSGGLCRGRHVKSPGVFIRPMMYQVREALFSMLGATDVFEESASALDLFAGSGVVGLESASRGTGQVTFVDASGTCAEAIQANCEELGFADRTRVLKTKAEHFLATPGSFGIEKPFDLVTMTPPYEEVDYTDLMAALGASPVIGEDTIIVVEYATEDNDVMKMDMGDLGAGGHLLGLRRRVFGRTILAVYVSQPSGKELGIRPKPKEWS